MATYDVETYLLALDVAAATLPDPTTVSSRTHLIANTGAVNLVVSSTGATPFSIGGVNVATMTIGRGNAMIVQSDGIRWVAKSSGTRPFYASSGTTDGSGNVTFTFNTPFAAVPDVAHSIETALSDATEARITAISVSAVTYNVRRSPAVTILGISVLSAPVAAVGVIVRVIATTPGQTP